MKPPLRRTRAFVSDYTRGLSTGELRRLVERDATRAYSVLMRDQPESECEVGGMRGVFRKAKLLFLSISAKLTPARRLLFAIGVGGALIGILGPNFVVDESGTRVSLDGSPFFFVLSIAALLFLLVLELVDRVLVRDELQVARQLQRDLLPSADPEVAGWTFAHSSRTANDIGGDYYQFAPLEDGRLAVVVADASGHGMAAGLLMAIANATLHVALDVDPEPLEVAKRLHGAIRRTGDRRSFLTLFYGLLDPASGELAFVCAGHPPPLVRRRDGSIEEPALGSFPLGLRDRLEPARGSLRLEPGDSLLLFTDGLFEGVDRAGSAFGYERVRGVLAREGGATALHRALLAAFEHHAAGEPLADDLTIVVLERTAAGDGSA
ncbi:MAG: PP2C family protein-serine/threonine phosphatase [Thermoanaerobaculia bacterium]